MAQCPNLDVAHAATWAEVRRWLADELPDLAIFEVIDGSGSHFPPLLLKKPGPLMIGLDAEPG